MYERNLDQTHYLNVFLSTKLEYKLCHLGKVEFFGKFSKQRGYFHKWNIQTFLVWVKFTCILGAAKEYEFVFSFKKGAIKSQSCDNECCGLVAKNGGYKDQLIAVRKQLIDLSPLLYS